MNAPMTTLDGRFSDPTAVATTWEAARKVLDAAELFWITTVRSDGRPNVSPLVAVWLDYALHFCTGSEEQKAVNLRRISMSSSRRAAMAWTWWSRASRSGRPTPTSSNAWPTPGAATGTAGGSTRFRTERFSIRIARTRRSCFSVAPTKVLAFGKGTFSQTRHTFA